MSTWAAGEIMGSAAARLIQLVTKRMAAELRVSAGKELGQAFAREPELKPLLRALGVRKVLPQLSKERLAIGTTMLPTAQMKIRPDIPEVLRTLLAKAGRMRQGKLTRPVVVAEPGISEQPTESTLAHESAHALQYAANPRRTMDALMRDYVESEAGAFEDIYPLSHIYSHPIDLPGISSILASAPRNRAAQITGLLQDLLKKRRARLSGRVE